MRSRGSVLIDRAWRFAAMIGCIALVAACAARASEASEADPGEAIYRRGLLESGQPLEAVREAGVRISGIDAACVNCHRRSGLGSKEGQVSIPPIAGRYLFHSGAEDLDLPYVESMRPDRSRYTDATLSRAIRDGIDADGRPLNYLMPRFALNDAEMAALLAYLKRLGEQRSPGVTDTVLHFATIVTPDSDPVKRGAMLDVLEHFFADKNAFPLGPTPRLKSSRRWKFMVNRRWQLHVWKLTGPAGSWLAQLKRHFAAEPVFAVLSGIGGGNWKPIHEFCEQQAVPCLFPNVEAPPAGADHDFYSLYFSRGVNLEAELIASRILHPAKGEAVRVIDQIYRAGDSGEEGARQLEELVERQGIKVRRHALGSGLGLRRALAQSAGSDAMVLWLRPPDISKLGKAPPQPVYLSGLMGGLDSVPLPEAWRRQTTMSYPFALPEERRVGVDFAFGWFKIRHIPIVAPQIEADTYLACGLLAETLKHMVDTFVPDYLVERIEDMLDQRLITGYYPHLSLAPNQRFASKGGYLVRFSDSAGAHLAADSGWIVP